jgi:hypothetical protein
MTEKICRERVCASQRLGGFLPQLSALTRRRDRKCRSRPRQSRGRQRVFPETAGNQNLPGLRGGPGRTRTCNQAVMSLALTIESGPIRALRCVCRKLRFSDSNIFAPAPDRSGRGQDPRIPARPQPELADMALRRSLQDMGRPGRNGHGCSAHRLECCSGDELKRSLTNSDPCSDEKIPCSLPKIPCYASKNSLFRCVGNLAASL